MTTQQRVIDLGPVARQVAGLLHGVGEERFADPTPCEDYRVRDLLTHLLELTLAFTAAGHKDLGPLTETAPDSPGFPRPSLEGDWRGRLRGQLDELVDAWRAPAAWEGTTQAGGVTLPAHVAGLVALDELLLHGWDLARATRQPFTCDDASARAAINLLSEDIDDAAREGTGFGPVVDVPAGAPLLDRAVGLGGRRPDWTPPAQSASGR